MSTDLTGYIDQTFDLVAWHGMARQGERRLTASLLVDDTDGEICTGIQLLVQRFLLQLLTESGTILRRPNDGTDFMMSLRQGRVRNEADLRAVFTLAELQARANLLREESAADPAEQRYAQTSITAVHVTAGTAILTLKLQSLASSVTVALPIGIVV